MSKVSLIALLLVPVLLLVMGVAIIGGVVTGVGAVFKSSPASCNVDTSIFDGFENFTDFLNQTNGCQQACAVEAGSGAGSYTPEQEANIRKILGTAQALGINEKGMVIAITTALVESGLKNYANDGVYDVASNPADATQKGNSALFTFAGTSLEYAHEAVGSDASSVGLFQQQAWWGTMGSSSWTGDPKATMKRLMDPYWGAQRFFQSMLSVADWENMDIGSVAQKVQVSAVPGAYTARVDEATKIVFTYKGSAVPPATLYPIPGQLTGSEAAAGGSFCGTGNLPLDKNNYYQVTSQWAQPSGESGGARDHGHAGMDFDCNEDYENVYSMVAGTVVSAVNGNSSGFGSPMGQITVETPEGIQIQYLHGRNMLASVGDEVSPGQPIMECASTGNSTGTHLHINFIVSFTDRADVKALPTASGVTAANRDPALGMLLLGVDICPPYTADRQGKTPGAAMSSSILKCWPQEEWVR